MRPPRTTPEPGEPATVQPARGRRAHAGPPADESAEHDLRLLRTPAPPTPRGRWTLRPRTVRAKIISLLMVPVVSLLALWGFATVTTAQDVARLRQLERVDGEVRAPMSTAVAALQSERREAMLQSAAPSSTQAALLERRAGRTDKALAALRLDSGHTIADTGNVPSEVADRLDGFLGLTRNLRADERAEGQADGDASAANAVYDRYTGAISAALGVSGALTTVQDDAGGSGARVRLELARADEMLAREDALLTTAARIGTLKDGELRQFTGAVETRRNLTETAGADLPAPGSTAWKRLTAGPAHRQIQAAEDKVLAAPAGRGAARAAPADDWERAVERVRTEARTIQATAGQHTAGRSSPLARGLFTPSGAAVLFGCVAVTASLVISVRIGRALVVELVSLRNSALEIARRKLPRAMQRLRSGQELDIGAEAPQGPSAHDEIAQVAEALGTVHRAALGAAVERAELADGISGVFVNLARRSQVLVHRQLNLLDSMERRADDPDELSDLFRLDHLTTRMRRHAESLIILSGAAPGRAWRTPVPLTDVVRAAVSEIEDYARTEVRQLPEAAVQGTAVADLTHLLAELIENAAQFSPPHTKVRISGEPVGNGYALEIEDRGLGMGDELLGEANRRIEQAEALDLFDSDRLGLFVVSRLAVRHHIKVQLRTSAYGGTTAVVLLPTALLQSALPSAGSPPAEDPVAERNTTGRRGGAHSRPPFGPGAGVRTGHGTRAARPTTTAFPPPAPAPALDAGRDPVHFPGPATVTALRGRPGRADQPSGALPRTESPPDEDTLPRRVRQASLVPQLREEPRPGEPPPGDGPNGTVRPPRLTPEQARDRMTAYRNGWLRGGGTAPGTSALRPDATDPRPRSEEDPERSRTKGDLE
ncbi:nitrate- and nitrite sensing domain-containing protein [Streptomyces sp. NPDC056921]|uniref:sensor histidine kinase n=1 Tax=Streptomyces sp. NPDC056921 TaxID=3345966 RepID=UPI00363A85C4